MAYSKITNFTRKDSLVTGHPDKVVSGAELDAEFNAIATASANTDATKLSTATAASTYAPIASPTFTGTPTAPTPTTGDSSTKLATTAFVAATALNPALPGQSGAAGKYLTSDGTDASWAALVAPQPGQNILINGCMRIAQRGTTFTPAASGYTLDRWWYTASTYGVNTISQVAGDNNSPYAVRIARPSGTVTQDSRLYQSIESSVATTLSGRRVVLSVRSKAGTGYNGNILAGLRCGTVADEGGNPDSWTGVTSPTGTTVETGSVSTSSYTTYAQYFDIPTGTKEIAVLIGVYFSGGTGSANDYFDLTDVQLLPYDDGDTTYQNFVPRPIAQELALCQRYYYRMTGSGVTMAYGECINATVTRGITRFPVTMRTAPTALEQVGNAALYTNYHTNVGTACSAVPTFSSASKYGAVSDFTVASGLTTGRFAYIQGNDATSYLGWSAEL